MIGKKYTALILEEEDSYIAIFPDLPGCISFSDTFVGAVEGAIKMLPSYIEVMIDGISLPPEPTPFDDANGMIKNEYGAEIVGKFLVSTDCVKNYG